MYNNKKIKLVAMSVAMMLGAQCAMADGVAIDVSTWSELQSTLKNNTSVDYAHLTNSITSTDSIKLGSNGYSKDITLDGGNSSLDINGISLSANSKTLFDIQPSTSLNIRNTVIKNISTSTWGGAIYNDGQLTADNMYFYNNKSGLSGAIANMSQAELTGSMKFENNTTTAIGGGAIFNIGSLDLKPNGKTLDFIGNTVKDKDNNITGSGGAIYNGKGSVAVKNETKYANSVGRIIFAKNGNYNFENNKASSGGAIYNQGVIDVKGNVSLKNNHAIKDGGALYNNSGNLNLIGTRASKDADASIIFEGNTAGLDDDGNQFNDPSKQEQYHGGAMYIVGDNSSRAYVNIDSVDFKNNKTNTHGGAVYFDGQVDFNIEGSKFINNTLTGRYETDIDDSEKKVWYPDEAGRYITSEGWGGAIGLGSGDIQGYINQSVFQENYSTNSGGVIASNTGLAIVNSTFTGNHAKFSAGAISWDPKPKSGSAGKYLNIIADGGDTVFAGNHVDGGVATIVTRSGNKITGTRQVPIAGSQEGVYIGNYLDYDVNNPTKPYEGNDSNVNFNAGNSGSLIFNDIVNAYGDSFDNKDKNGYNPLGANHNIQLNASGVEYGRLESSSANSIPNLAPTDGMIIFNNTVKGANLVLHNGTLAFHKQNNLAEYVGDNLENYFSNGAKITLKGGTLDLANDIIEGQDGKNHFNPASIDVLGNANLRLDITLNNGTGTIDYIDSAINNSNGATLTIDKLLFNNDMNSTAELGANALLQFVRENNMSANTFLADSLKTVITSQAGYSLELAQKGTTANDSIKITKVVSAGGLPVAVSVGQDEALSGEKTYVYNATDDEIIGTDANNSWYKGYKVQTTNMNNPEDRYTSNILKGEYLEINGNSKNVIAAENGIIGLVLDADTYYPENISITNQTLTINDVKKADGTGWNKFNTAILNKGGTVNLNNSIFSDNHSTDGTYKDVSHKDSTGAVVDGQSYQKLGNGGAIQNLNRTTADGSVVSEGTLNITNTNFTNNSATGNGGAIYNDKDATTNITATGSNTVEFTGNTAGGVDNDIYNAGILNLATSLDGKIIFNGGISGNNGTMNVGTDTVQNLGSIVMNSTIANQTVNLNSGILQIGSTDKAFENSNLTFNGGILNSQNNKIDDMVVGNLNLNNSNSQFTFDVDLSNNKADNISFSTIEGNATLNVGTVYIKNTLGDTQFSSEFLKGTNAEIITSAYKGPNVTTVDGVAYSVGVNHNVINISKVGTSGGFVYDVVDENISGHQVSSADNGQIGNWINGDNKLQGLSFTIYGKGLDTDIVKSENNILGIEVGYDSNQEVPQSLTIQDVTSYGGFNSAVINNGGVVSINGANLIDNNSTTTNGGAIQNNTGVVNIGVTSNVNNVVFSGNKAANGGAIYNNDELDINTALSGNTITFKQNYANGELNDIWNTGVASINLMGDGSVRFDSGIGGFGDINSSTNLILGSTSNNSNFKGAFEQTLGTTTVENGSKFFEGVSTINGGTLNWYTNNDLTNGTLNLLDTIVKENNQNVTKHSKLVVGDGTKEAQLSIGNGSSFATDTVITINDKANLTLVGKTMEIANISGNGKLTADGSTLTYNKNSGVTKSFASKNSSTVTVDGTDNNNVDSILKAIVEGENKDLTLNLKEVTTSQDIDLGNTDTSSTSYIKNLNTLGNVTLNGTLNNTGSTVTNSGNLQLNGNVENRFEFVNNENSIVGINSTFQQLNGSITNKGELNIAGSLTSVSNQGTPGVINGGTINLTGDASGYVGHLESTGTINVASSEKLFGGSKLIKSGELNINAGKIDYTNISLGDAQSQGGKLNQIISEADRTKINDTVIKFTDETTGSKASFTSKDGVTANIDLAKVDNGKENTISIDKSNVTLVSTDYRGGTIYNFDNSNIKLGSENTTVGDYDFSHVTGSNNKLSFNVIIADVEGATDGSKYLKTDKLTIGNDGQEFKFGDIYISGKENGWNGTYETKDGNVLNGATFSDKIDKLATGATTAWIYDISKTEDGKSIQMVIKDYANNDTLYKMNHETEGTRFFQFSDDSSGAEKTYNIGKSLDETLKGNFTVRGYGSDKCTISGEIVNSSGQTTGSRGSFFDIKNDDVTLTIKDVTLANASKATSGSVVNNESTVSTVNISNAIIKGASSSSVGGAIFNNGNLNISNTTFTNNNAGIAGDESTQKGGAIYNKGKMTLSGVTIDARTNSANNDIYQEATGNTELNGNNTINSSIGGKGSIKNTGNLTLSADNSNYTGTYTQENGSTNVKQGSKFFGGESTINAGTLNWNTDNEYNGTLKVEGGTVNIEDRDGASLTLNDGSYIKKEARVKLSEGSDITIDGGSLTLDNNDSWKGEIFIGDENNTGSGTLTIDGLTKNGGFAFNGGTIDLVNGALSASQNDIITTNTTVKIGDGTLLNIDGGDITLGANTEWKSEGGVLLDNGKLTVNNFSGTNGILQANNGTLDIIDSTLTVGNNSHIKGEVATSIYTDSILNITDNGYVKLDDDDSWGGKVSLNGGTLDYTMTANGHYARNEVLEATTGNLNLFKDSYLEIKQPSKIEEAVAVNIQRGATVNVANRAELNLDSNDIWAGLIMTQTNGILKTNNVDNSSYGGQIQQNRGTAIFDNNSNIYIDGKDSYIVGGRVEILNGSKLNIGSEVGDSHFYVNNLKMENNSTLSVMNNTLNNYTVSNGMTVNGKNNVSIDVDGRNKVGDTFLIDNLTTDSNGTLNISDFNFVGLAPIDRQFKIRVFDANSIDSNVSFTATDKEILTPIGYYNMQSAGGGWYTSNMTRYNPQVFRGQVATLASYNNQLMIDDMLLNHVTLDSERLLAQGRNANTYASTLPQFAPYQYKKEDGGLWFKSYVNFENLSLTQGLKVGNNSYGSLVGADFPVVNLKHGWRLMPTAYIGYNGAHQTFNGVGMYQNGGQGGLMGTFMKDDFIGSIVAYAGGYNNEMSVAGSTDHTGNWFAGTAAKLAYNFHPTKHFTIQPTAFMSYNIFGRQNWGTDFGSMSMNSGLLNGINIAPGMNFIYARETWSVYATFQYMYNINEQVGGRAGNVDLAGVKMEHGYIQYGVGVTKTWKDRLNSFFQIVFRNGGRTGVGFQLGLNYTFDWLNPKSNKTPKANAAQMKKTKTSIKKSQTEKEFQHVGSKTVVKSLSMK